MPREEWAHSASDFASRVGKSAIMVQKGCPPYDGHLLPKKEKEILEGHFKCIVQIPEVTHELVILATKSFYI